jgi:hypothetical protein
LTIFDFRLTIEEAGSWQQAADSGRLSGQINKSPKSTNLQIN